MRTAGGLGTPRDYTQIFEPAVTRGLTQWVAAGGGAFEIAPCV
jgi:hypothetical protein